MNKLIIVALLVLSCSCFAFMSPILPSNSSETSTVSNDLRGLLYREDAETNVTSEHADNFIEEVKARILKNLRKKEAPRRHVPLPELQTLNFSPTVESQHDESVDKESRVNLTRRTKTRFLYAYVENTTCFDENASPCVRFQFEIPALIESQDIKFAELWLYKRQNVTEYEIARIINGSDGENIRLTTTVVNQTSLRGWTRFNVLKMLQDENVTTLNLEICLELSDWSLDFGETTKPFLLVKTEEKHISKRAARDCTTENSTCCREKYYVLFEDVGWADWIVQPEGYDANLCRGSCSGNIGLPLNHHGQVFAQLCERKPHKLREMRKLECISCNPIVYQPVSVIYLDEDGVQVVSHMPDMSVSKCGCI